MPTAKSILQVREDHVRKAEDDEYQGSPPSDKNLTQHLLPQGLDELETLNSIRRAHRVYITREKPNVLDIRCDSAYRLQQALQAINWAIRDMRLSNDHSTVRFLVQKPTNAIISDMIKAELGMRPHFVSRSPQSISNASAMNGHLQQLAAEITNSAESLMALNKTVGMRVNFGHLVIGKRKKGSQDEISHDDFVKLMDMYTVRGGGSFETKLQDASKAEKFLQFLVNSEQLACNDLGDVKKDCEVTVVAQGQEIKANAENMQGQRMQLSMVRTTKPETWGRLNWTVAAPDMQYDWSFRVDAWEKVDTPTGFKELAQKVWLVADANEDALFSVPHINTARLAMLDNEISQIRVKSSARVPYRETPYAIEVNVTKTLKGSHTRGEPEITWGVELYAPHWDESVNHASGGRKNWGKKMENIWWDEGPDVKSRLGGFFGTILEVQALLNRAGLDAASP
ncbi:hypothetical protein FZEAL_8602 [Fusarium zealandicum]|uniref:Uncharacterized protein n=1 Tax=Fusarium zealandicum TaxID=1053134 RepID=A0A8H4XGP8_9HYPO|nr:hypothetical protein FZEAL_8602 [Fusarium zealandicum]